MGEKDIHGPEGGMWKFVFVGKGKTTMGIMSKIFWNPLSAGGEAAAAAGWAD